MKNYKQPKTNKMEKICGDFELKVYTDGYPNTIFIRKHLNSSVFGEIRFTHKEIKDLKHLIDIAERECKNNLSDKDKNEV